MMKISLPYGREKIQIEIPDSRLSGVLASGLHDYSAEYDEHELVRRALENPIESDRLSKLAEGKKRIVLLASDHTRPVPSKVIVPQMLSEIRSGSPDADVTILIATGSHRATTVNELADKFGDEIMRNEKIILHDCNDDAMMVKIGTLPSGGNLVLNRLAVEADLLVAEGFIEPHFFAGFSGGRKSVFPGVAARETVLYNHNASFIASDRARTGIIESNPIHSDMIYAAKKAKLAFIVNVVINAEKKVIHAVAGDCDKAHMAGCAFLSSRCGVSPVLSDIAVTTNGGYPLDQNIYQAVKSMTAAEATVKEGGVIIVFAESGDGHGGEEFYRTFKDEKNLDLMLKKFMATPSGQTIPDQWQSQIFARVLRHARVIYISAAPDEMVREMHMAPAHSFPEALEIADRLLGGSDGSICVIPDGVSVIVK